MSVSASAVDGLVSGLDTASIITKLIAVDSSPQTALKNNVTAANAKVTAYQGVSSSMAAVQAAADALQLTASWASTKASSSDTAITVTAGSSATPASLDVKVDAIALGRSVISQELNVNAGGVVVDNGTPAVRDDSRVPIPIDIVRSDGSYVTINPNSGKLSDVVDAINKASSIGVNAVAIRVGENKYRLQITSSKTGAAAGDFTIVAHTGAASAPAGSTGYPLPTPGSLTGLTAAGSYTPVTAAADAQITLGPPGATAVLTSATNTFADVMPAVAVTVSKVTASAGKVTVASDPDALAAAVQGLVDAANKALTNIAAQSKAGVVGANGEVSGKGVLRGDSALRTLQSQLLQAVTSGLGASGTSAATVGVQSTRDGVLTFDKAKFLSAYAAAPAAVQSLVSSKAAGTSVTDVVTGTTTPATDGIVERLRKVTVYAVGDIKASPTTASGALTATITGQQKSIDDLTNRIADWDVRLADKKARYQKYYSSLEVSLGKLQSQSTWLSGQLASLSKSS